MYGCPFDHRRTDWMPFRCESAPGSPNWIDSATNCSARSTLLLPLPLRPTSAVVAPKSISTSWPMARKFEMRAQKPIHAYFFTSPRAKMLAT